MHPKQRSLLFWLALVISGFTVSSVHFQMLSKSGSCVFGWKLQSVSPAIAHVSAQFDVDIVSRVNDVDECDEVKSTSSYKFEVENVQVNRRFWSSSSYFVCRNLATTERLSFCGGYMG